MSLSVFDLFKIGIGPSSSHTVGPMKAALAFAQLLQESGPLSRVESVRVDLFGSLGATGEGHGTPKAIVLGLMGYAPESVDVAAVESLLQAVREQGSLSLLGQENIPFVLGSDLKLIGAESLPHHPNGMRFTARFGDGSLVEKDYYSIGGGFVLDGDEIEKSAPLESPVALARPFSTAVELLAQCREAGMSISSLMLENELAWREEAEVRRGLLEIWAVMDESIEQGCRNEGILPGGLDVPRRAGGLYQKLKDQPGSSAPDSLGMLDWVTLYAMAVNEQNAAGGRIVTAPTNGAAGIIPAVLKFFLDTCPDATDDDICRYLLTAGAIGILFKTNASISGAEVGCQGEVGSACSMAAAGLAEVLGASVPQVENAAEIAMEHNLGLTCDPIGGLVQVPCIERNAMASIKAISAARMSLRGDGEHFVSLDQVIATMRDTGRDMQDKYKETALGGLAVNVGHVPVANVEC
ncbi:MAG: L-serine ammonia-lyase [Pseudomonadota bacterium]